MNTNDHTSTPDDPIPAATSTAGSDMAARHLHTLLDSRAGDTAGRSAPGNADPAAHPARNQGHTNRIGASPVDPDVNPAASNVGVPNGTPGPAPLDEISAEVDPQPAMTARSYSLAEVAAMCLPREWKDGERWLSRRISRGEIPAYKVGRVWRMTDVDVTAFIDSRRKPPKPKPDVVDTNPPTPRTLRDALSPRSRARLERYP